MIMHRRSNPLPVMWYDNGMDQDPNEPDWDALSEHLKNLGVGMDDLTAPSSIDSCLLNSPIDAYLVPGRHPHLWQT